jgi:DNA/RNA-binding domain of Phe-tRNA-synthetase-like protein
MIFGYDAEIREQFPGLRVAAIHARGLANGPSASGLVEAYAAEQRAALERLRTSPIAELPSIVAWRRAFSQFGAKPTQHRNAAEALLRRLDKQGEIPSISTLVDIGNLVSIRHAVPVACFDLSQIAVGLTVRFASGDEPFADLGSSETVHPEAGEIVFADDGGVVHARRWCWRQSAQSATGPPTTEALFVIEGHHEEARRDVDQAAADLGRLLQAYEPGARIAASSAGG